MMSTSIKRWLAMLMSGVMMLAVLTGCGSSASETAEEAPQEEETETSDTPESWTADNVANALEGVTLTVATSGTYGPFSYYDSDGTTLIGYDMDLLYALQDLLGFEMTTEQPTTMTYTALVSSLSEGKVDMVLAGLGISDERKEVMNFSDPYYTDGLCVIVNSETNPGITSFDDLTSGDYKVGVEAGTVAHTYVAGVLPESCLEVHDSITTAYESLDAGKLDAVVELRAGAAYHKNTTGDEKLEIIGDNITDQSYAIGISFDVCDRVDGFVEIIDAALDALEANGTLDELNSTWCS